MAEQLKEHSIECRFYHGSLSTEGLHLSPCYFFAHQSSENFVIVRILITICAAAERTDVHYAFLSGVVRVVVATVAFGMGYARPRTVTSEAHSCQLSDWC